MSTWAIDESRPSKMNSVEKEHTLVRLRGRVEPCPNRVTNACITFSLNTMPTMPTYGEPLITCENSFQDNTEIIG